MTPRTGTAWDVLAVVALLAPLAGVSVPLAGTGDRQAVVLAGRLGALAAATAWGVVLAASAAPELGRFGPDPFAAAAAAGACLVAAFVATDDAGVGAVLAPPAASAVALAVGAATPPTSLSGGAGVALATTAAGVAVAAVLAPNRWRAAGVVVPGALVVALWAADATADPPAAAGIVLAGFAVALAATHARRLRHLPLLGGLDAGRRSVAALSVAAVGVAVGPVVAARSAGPLLAAAAVLTAIAGRRWAMAAALPGAAVVATALADVPASGGGGSGAHVVVAVLLAAAAAGLVAAPWPEDRARPPEGLVVAAVLVAWLAIVPGSWGWAVGDADLLDTWDRAAAVAAAGAAAALAVLGAAANLDRWSRRVRH